VTKLANVILTAEETSVNKDMQKVQQTVAEESQLCMYLNISV